MAPIDKTISRHRFPFPSSASTRASTVASRASSVALRTSSRQEESSRASSTNSSSIIASASIETSAPESNNALLSLTSTYQGINRLSLSKKRKAVVSLAEISKGEEKEGENLVDISDNKTSSPSDHATVAAPKSDNNPQNSKRARDNNWSSSSSVLSSNDDFSALKFSELLKEKSYTSSSNRLSLRLNSADKFLDAFSREKSQLLTLTEEEEASTSFSVTSSLQMNGQKRNNMDSRFSSGGKNPPAISSLCNLGNTCFLNSVLYTLRFTPGFLHSLHHMVFDLGLAGNGSGGQNKKKNGNGSGYQNGTASGQESAAANNLDADAEMVNEIIEQLHDLFKTLASADENPDVREPIPPSSFLASVGKLNPMFEGNHQQDAHELLVMLLNILQDIKIPASTSDISTVPENKLPENPGNKPGKKKTGKSFLYNGSSSLSSSNNSQFPSNNGVTVQNGLGKMKITDSNSSSSSSNCIDQPASLLVKSPPPLLPNFVKENFEGKSVMRTKCLECEMSTFRSETFTNIDIPLQFDEEDDEMSGKDLFLKQILASETLRENNKYWCEQCSRLNEAQRSVEYELLPKVLVLQLKRFTATGTKTYMSKINDYIPTPFTLNCFCMQCMRNSGGGEQFPAGCGPKHYYKLYAVIMHLGATLASGHYIAYVRASDPSWEYLSCPRGNSVERGKNKKGIMKYLTRNTGSSSTGSATNGGSGSSSASCRSANCCGIKVLNNLSSAENGGSRNSSSNQLSASGSIDSGNSHSSLDTPDHHSLHSHLHSGSGSASLSNGHYTNGTNGSSSLSSSSPQDASVPEDLWLECDDESIASITRKQFEDLLSSKQGATTPYLLFYHKV